MNRENENISESCPEIAAVEAGLAQLRPRRAARFADEVKSRIRDALSDKAPASDSATTVRVPLKHYIRIAQFNAAAGGLLVGLIFGALLGGMGVYFALGRFETREPQPVQSVYPVPLPYARMLLEHDPALTPPERAFLDQFDKEPR